MSVFPAFTRSVCSRWFVSKSSLNRTTSSQVRTPTNILRQRLTALIETLFGLWRTYSSLDPYITATGETDLTSPNRLLLPNIIDFHWRDKANTIPWFLTAAFPSSSVQSAEDWQDYVDSDTLFLFDRVLLSDRAAALRHEDFPIDNHLAGLTHRLISSPDWWVPIRNVFHQLVEVNHNSTDLMMRRPIITYISRQGYGNKSLKPEDHDDLVRELNRLEGARGYEIHVYRADDLSVEDQIKIAARTTV